MSDRLDKTFNITPEVVPEEKTEVIKKEKPDRLTKDDITRDYEYTSCLLYTSPSPRDRQKSRMPSSA